jgi:hypothetical protein
MYFVCGSAMLDDKFNVVAKSKWSVLTFFRLLENAIPGTFSFEKW